MRRVALICCVALVGCAGESADRPRESAVSQALDLPWEPEQGPHVLGSFADRLMVTRPSGQRDYIRVSTQPVNRAGFVLSVSPASDGANLIAVKAKTRYEKADPWFEDMKMAASNGGQIRITTATLVTANDVNVDGVVTNADSTIYTLEYRPPVAGGGFGAWQDYCDGHGGAIALHGGFDGTGTHDDVAAITFACENAITLKCNFWGYVAGNGGKLTDGWRYHQACIRMGRADYCRTGQSFTRDRTPIKIRDDVSSYGHDADGPTDTDEELTHPIELPGDPDTYYIEAGWDENGPLCLSKIRWAALPPSPCDDKLPDPRFSDPEDHPDAEFCDGKSMADLFADGALIVNGSKMMDAPLHRWRRPGGSGTSLDVVSTIRGYFIDRVAPFGVPDPSSTLPFPGYTEHLGTEGMLLRNLPGTLLESQMRPLYMQSFTTPGDKYLSDTGGGRTDPSFEGYSFWAKPTITIEGLPINGLWGFNECTWSGGNRDTKLAGSAASATCSFARSLSFALPAP